jgi:nucleotide-binding universal stress UspA family protein
VLIVMRTRGLEGSRRWFTRHTAEQVVGMAPCPVLSVRRRFLRENELPASTLEGAPRMVLVPVDLTPSSALSLRYAASLAEQSHAEVTLLQVVRMPAPNFRSDALFVDQVPDTLRESAEQELVSWAARHAPRNAIRSAIVRFSYNPAGAVVNLAEQLNPQLIVITPEKRSWLGRVLKESVARKLIRHVRAPVLCLNQSGRDPDEPGTQPSVPSAIRRFRPVLPLI